MAGQRVVSRTHKAPAKIGDAGAEHCGTGGSPSKRSLSPSPVKNPFKRKKRRWWTTDSKCLWVGFGVCLLVFWTSDTDWTGLAPKNPGDSHQNSPRGELHLRPAFLTDDGKEDVDDTDDAGATDDGNEAEEEDDGDYEEEQEQGEEYEEEAEEHEEPEGEGQEELEGEEEEKNADTPEDPKVRHRSPSLRDPKQQHQIPRVLIFTHYKNLLELEVPSTLLIGTNHSTDRAAPDAYENNLTPEKLEEFTLAINVRHSIDIHNQSAVQKDKDLRVVFWTDKDCIQSLQRTRPKLVSYFETETEGMYKADICRGTALLEHGGFYLDVDVGVRHDLWQDLRPQTEFVTARVHQASNWVGKGFFQAVLGASPENPVLERYLELFEKHYNGISRIDKGPLGVLLLKRAWDQVNGERKRNEIPEISTELYQEFLFHKNGPFDTGDNQGVLSPAPTWGKRRACHFLVAGMANYPSNVEILLERGEKQESDKKKPIALQIPVLSRIPGSRMCVTNSTKTGSSESKSLNTTLLIESMKWWERT